MVIHLGEDWVKHGWSDFIPTGFVSKQKVKICIQANSQLMLVLLFGDKALVS